VLDNIRPRAAETSPGFFFKSTARSRIHCASSYQFGSYDVGDLVKATDALGRSVNLSMDAVGRTVEVTDALGNRTSFSLDALDRVTQVIDAMGRQTAMAFDENGNLKLLSTRTNAVGTSYSMVSSEWSITFTVTNRRAENI
jgi:YD repeat-containing protein